MTPEMRQRRAVAITYGIYVEGSGESATEFEVCSAEACFVQDKPSEETGVILWTGSYPFAQDHDMGSMPTFEDAVRYAVWLLKREAFYHEKMEAQWMEPTDG